MRLNRVIMGVCLGFLAAQAGDRFSAGIGMGYSTSLYKGVDDKAIVLPMLEYESGDFYIKGVEAGYTAVDSHPYTLDVVLRGRMEGYESDDSDVFEGMEDRKGSLEGGLEASMMIRRAKLSLSWQHDLLGEHEGHETTLKLSFMHGLGNLMINPFLGASWMSEALTEYYYGVRPQEARSSRAAYAPDGCLGAFMGVSLMYAPNERWGLMLNTRVVSYGDEIKDSPLVEDATQASLLGGFTYRF